MVGDHKRIDRTDLILFESKEYSPVNHSRELILKYKFKTTTFIESFVQKGFVSNGYRNELVDKISIQITLPKNG